MYRRPVVPSKAAARESLVIPDRTRGASKARHRKLGETYNSTALRVPADSTALAQLVSTTMAIEDMAEPSRCRATPRH